MQVSSMMMLHKLITCAIQLTVCKCIIMPRQDWSKLDLEEVDRQWNADDKDIITKDEELFREGEKRREEAMKKIDDLMKNDPKGHGPGSREFERLAEEAQNAGKPAMIFAKLHARDTIETAMLRSLYTPRRITDSNAWDWETMAALCDEWEVRYLHFQA